MTVGHLAGRRILVVGAGTAELANDPDPPVGNGRAIAVRCGREGAAVACADISRAAADATAALVVDEGARATVVVADVASAEDCERLVVEADEALGGLDGIVLNVGIGQGVRLEGTSIRDWDRTLDVNLRSHFAVCKAALPRLADGSSIVFISSIAGIKPGSQIPAYDASKAAIPGLARHVALEGARRGIRANVVAPGLIDTVIGRRASQGRPSRDRTPVPLGRQGTAWEVAAAVSWLLSDDASYVTGQVLAVDGGLSALR